MGEEGGEFDDWLCERLRDLRTDETVFAPYIKSILEGDEDEEEKIEAVDELLAELQGNFNVESVRNEILQRWNNQGIKQQQGLPLNPSALLSSPILANGDTVPSLSQIKSESSSECKQDGKKDPESLLVDKMESIFKLTEEQSRASSSSGSTKGGKGDIGADSALRAAILSQLGAGDSSDGEDEETEGAAGGVVKKSGIQGVERNVNAEKVLAERQELKEKSRAEHAKKKERDKEDRNKQKQAQQERKDKAKKKAQKVERRR